MQYNMDTVEFLIAQEVQRRFAAGERSLNETEIGAFRRRLVAELIVAGDAVAAISLRPQLSVREQLNG